MTPRGRMLLRVLFGVILPIAALIAVIVVLRGAGVPVTVPGIILVLIVALVLRLWIGRRRRRALERKGRAGGGGA